MRSWAAVTEFLGSREIGGGGWNRLKLGLTAEQSAGAPVPAYAVAFLTLSDIVPFGEL